MALSSYRLPWTGSGWDGWLRALDGKSGVYVIKSKDAGTILYVGESHSGTLYGTIARHFQAWDGRSAGWRGNRDRVLVAVELTRASEAPDRQYALIARLKPRDNEVGRTRAQDHRSGIRKVKPKAKPNARGWWKDSLPF